jgi:5-formyltetrahydrofolate cyclo-ligase
MGMSAPQSEVSLQAAKRELRREIVARRGRLPPALGGVFGALAASRLGGWPEYREARTVLCFASFRGEIPTVYLLRDVLARAKRLVLPLVFPATRELQLHLVDDLNLLRLGRWGIPEPDSSWPAVEVRDVDLVVAPGVAFDLCGNRLGYGGGYYDGLLGLVRAGAPGRAAPAVGFGYELQIVPRVPVGPRDRALDGLVTERADYRFSRGAAEEQLPDA